MTLEGYPQLTTLVAIVLSGPLRTGARAGGGGCSLLQLELRPCVLGRGTLGTRLGGG